MASLFKMSEAASLALHAMSFLAMDRKRKTSAKEIAARLQASEPHLAKVLQRLAKNGLVKSSRGPGGGFTLSRAASEITLLQIYETIEGPLEMTTCLFDHPICMGEQCIIGGLIGPVDRQAMDYLSKTRLSALNKIFAGEDND